MTSNWNHLALKAYQARQARKHYEELEQKLIEDLKLASNNQTTIGDRFVFLREERVGPVDYSVVPELSGIDLGRYRKPEVTIWRLAEK